MCQWISNIGRLMNAAFFESVDLRPLAVAGKELEGEVTLSRLPRVRDLLENTAGAVRVAFRFSLRGDGRVLIRSELEGELPLKCQRCLGEFVLPVASKSELVVIDSAATAASLDDSDVESVISEDGSLVLADVVEEELLLALPIAPKHDNVAECAAVTKDFVVSDQPEKPVAQTHQPFKDLKDLLH